MNPGLEYYRPWGQPAQGWFCFGANPVAGDTLAIGATNYVAGSAFEVASGAAETAKNFAAAVNGDRSQYPQRHNQIVPHRTVFAMYYGIYVCIVATEPGVAGNAITLTGVTGVVATSGATLTGGSAAALAVTATVTSSAPTTADATAVVWADYVRAGTGAAITLGAAGASTKARLAIVYAPAVNTGTVNIGPNSSVRHPLIAGQSYTLPTIPGAVFDLNSWYMNGADPNTLTVLYVA